MRNLEERMAEIDRRSKIIEERRRRRGYILSACIPVVLCLGIGATFALLPGGASNEGAVIEGELNNRVESVETSITQIRVTGNGELRTHTDPTLVSRIWKCLDAVDTVFIQSGSTDVSLRGETEDDLIGDPDSEGSVSDWITDSADVGYTITLTMQDGETEELHLVENILVNRTTQKVYLLKKQELAALQEALGIG